MSADNITTKDYQAVRAALAKGFKPCVPSTKGAFIALGEAWEPRHGVDSLGETLEALINWGLERERSEAQPAQMAGRHTRHHRLRIPHFLERRHQAL